MTEMLSDSGAQLQAYAALLQRAATDAELRKRLLAEPKTLLRENGIEVAENLNLRVLENSADTAYIVLPSAAAARELSATELEAVAGGGPYPGGDVSIVDMFEMQMMMNKLSQLSEMSTGIVSASNSAIGSMARNVKS